MSQLLPQQYRFLHPNRKPFHLHRVMIIFGLTDNINGKMEIMAGLMVTGNNIVQVKHGFLDNGFPTAMGEHDSQEVIGNRSIDLGVKPPKVT